MSWQPTIFDPLAFSSLSESIARELSQAATVPLADLPPFEGPGIYALYYTGNFESYAPLSAANRQAMGSWPIYVGKAEASTRKGKTVLAPDDLSGNALYKRLLNHTASLEAAKNLELSDFHARVLVLKYVWVPMAETAAIGMYQPLWNTLIDGFGNHDPGKGRYQGERPRWDTLHPGRAWADRLKPNSFDAKQIGEEAYAWLAGQAGERWLIVNEPVA